MKKISAEFIFPGNSTPIKNGVVVFDVNGTIETILKPELDKIDWNEVEKYKGIICPGFVNTHCHLELSYLKGQLTKETELHGFIKEIISVRDKFTEEERLKAIDLADNEMINNGIVAVGDISNVVDTFAQKSKGNLRYFTFVEFFDFLQNIINQF